MSNTSATPESSPPPCEWTGSDLGRRLADRRHLLGLSLADVAARAGMDPGYLAYVESSAHSSPSLTALLHLAEALETSPEALRGSSDLAQANDRASSLEVLSREECLALLAPGGVGRFVFLDSRGPVALPVNFSLEGDDIVFRTAPGSNLELRSRQIRTSLEADRLDEALAEGWSVLVSGFSEPVLDEQERRRLLEQGPQPWAGGERSAVFRLHPVDVTGRRIRAPALP